ncbi:MAG: DMT family transporter [Pseudorhodobacter sp.]|nr:DMT family transporter [Pseudorhodobacter sp.]
MNCSSILPFVPCNLASSKAVSAACIDQFGLFGAVMRSVTLMQLGGVGVMVAGIVIIQRG